MRLALAQINTTVGDLDGNRERILGSISEAEREGADLVLLPELAVTGYPPEDLLLRPSFVRAAEESLAEIARGAQGIVAQTMSDAPTTRIGERMKSGRSARAGIRSSLPIR